MSTQIIFIMWRESVEALLIIGILQAWILNYASETKAARYLWGGVGSGLVLAALMAFALFKLSAQLPENTHDYFLIGMMTLAMFLIMQMVLWMRSHGRTLKANLEDGLNQAKSNKQWWSIFLLALIAVAREGSETVVFIYGLVSSAPKDSLALYGSLALGFGAAIISYFILQLGGRFLSWRFFFKVTEILLLLVGCSLAVSIADKLISLGILPFSQTVWSSAWLLDDGSRFGGIVAALTGYRSRPDWTIVIVWLVYWAMTAFLIKRQSSKGVINNKRSKPTSDNNNHTSSADYS